MLQSNDFQIDYTEYGSGPAVLFIPGSYSTSAAWRPMQKALPDAFRVISTSLCGYGDTSETRTLQDFRMEHELRIIKTIAEHVGEPMHLVGHSFGATVALAAGMSKEIDILSLSLFEANPVDILQATGQTELFNQTQEICNALEASHFAGNIDAPRIVIDFWDGAGAFDGLPEAARLFCQSHALTNVLDWKTFNSLAAGVTDYQGIEIPTLLVRGSESNPPMVALTDTLGDTIPDNQIVVIEGASHSLIMTHAQECADTLLRAALG
jgi:pimeloyl-ACP methyl ester carboxylesterase